MALLTVSDLRVAIPLAHGVLHPVRGVSFALERGQTLGIVGESGCGKSLTALALMGLLPRAARVTAARLTLGARDLLALSQRELAREVRGSRMAMIFQEPMTSLNPVYTIGRQLTEAMMLHRKCTQADARARAVQLLERVGISGAARRMGQYPHQISGGQRQRVMIAIALMNEPEVLIADEPTTALDVTIQAQILRLLAELREELGMALVLITHNLGIVSRVADRIAVMYAGELVETGRTADLFSDPLHPYTRGLLASIPQPGKSRPGARLGSIRGIVPSLVGTIRGCAFAARCDYARPACEEAPPLRTGGTERDYRCVMTTDETRVPTANVGEARAIERVMEGREVTEGNRGRFPSVRVAPRPEPKASGATFPSVRVAPRPEPKASGALIAARDIVCHFKVKRGLFGKAQRLSAVNGVTLEVGRGEVLALVGESGCGKTTLARVLLGLVPSQSGHVEYGGAPIEALGRRALAKKVQPIFQDPYSSLNPRRTVGEIVRRPLDVHDVGSRTERTERVEEMMALVGLSKRLLHSYPNQISGGQRQRAAIARAIIMHPGIVICDEPTSALDVSVQSQILNLLTDLRDELDLAYLLITHDLAVVEHMATRVAVMYFGEIIETGAASDVFGAPRHPYTRALLASALTVTPGGGVPDNRMGSTFPNPLEMPSGCTFHPRCPSAMPVCSVSAPAVAGTAGAFVRCHLHTERA